MSIEPRRTVQFTDPRKLRLAGDSCTITLPLGTHTLRITASIHVDDTTTPDDFDASCFTPERLDAWKRGDWQFLGVVVTMHICCEEIDTQSLWGIDVGEDPRYLMCVANDLLGQFDLPLRTPSFDECYSLLDTPA